MHQHIYASTYLRINIFTHQHIYASTYLRPTDNHNIIDK